MPPALPTSPLIAAFYYPWYGAPATDGTWLHWQQAGHTPPQDIASDSFPVLGAYSSNDPAVLEQHMRWLRRAGVELIITSWWGQGSYEDRAVPALLAAAENNGIGVAFHLEPYRGRSADQIAADVTYLYRQYGSSPAFYRTDAGSRHNAPGRASGLFFLWNPFVRYTGGPKADAAYWRAGLDQSTPCRRAGSSSSTIPTPPGSTMATSTAPTITRSAPPACSCGVRGCRRGPGTRR